MFLLTICTKRKWPPFVRTKKELRIRISSICVFVFFLSIFQFCVFANATNRKWMRESSGAAETVFVLCCGCQRVTLSISFKAFVRSIPFILTCHFYPTLNASTASSSHLSLCRWCWTTWKMHCLNSIIHFNLSMGFDFRPLTAHIANRFITIVSATVSTRTNDSRRSASAVATSQRAIETRMCPCVCVQSLEQTGHHFWIAQTIRFIAAVHTTYAWITKLIFGQTFATSTTECADWTTAEKKEMIRLNCAGGEAVSRGRQTFPWTLNCIPTRLRRSDTVCDHRTELLAIHTSRCFRIRTIPLDICECLVCRD